MEGAFQAITPREVAAGPDRIFYEHIKDTQEMLLKHWMDLVNKYVQLGQIPQACRHSSVKTLFKGKGGTKCSNNYRGIALEDNTFKILMKVLTKDRRDG
jgi:hypothetical protein